MTPEEKADKVIAGMVSTGLAMAVIPLPLGVPFMAAMGTGVTAIGTCYGVKLTKDEAWKLIREFFRAAGSAFMALNVGWIFIDTLTKATGVGYPLMVTLDAVQGSAIAYAIGAASKHYFSGQRGRQELGIVMRQALREGKRTTIFS